MKLNRITLFKNGIGFFEGEACVKEGRFSMEFKKEQMPDVLKTFQIVSENGDCIPFSVFDTAKTLEKTLEDIGINIPPDGSLKELLKQSIGYEVSVKLKSGKTLDGIVLGLDQKTSVSKGGDSIKEPTVVLHLDDGSVKSVPFEDMLSISLKDEGRKAELKRFLEEMRKSKKKEAKALDFVFAGSKSPKRARISYLAEIPVWKVSYRLNMDGKKGRLSCWAIVENGTSQDWEDVQLSLASGKPISFNYDIYTGRYARRPTLTMPEESTLLPADFQEVVPERDLAVQDEEALDKEKRLTKCEKTKMEPSSMRGYTPPVPMAAPQMPEEKPEFAEREVSFSREISVHSSEVEDTTIYSIAGKVNVPKGKSLSIPLFSKEVKVSKVSVYNADNHSKHPMRVVELTNDTKSAWQTGPLVIFDSGIYTGESILKNIKVGEKKKLSYALDTDIFVSDLGGSIKSIVSRVLCEKGVVYFEYCDEELNEYAIKNKGDSKKKVIIEHPKKYGAVSVSPKPDEETTDFYRFTVNVGAKETKKLKFKIVTSKTNSVKLLNNPDLATNLSWYLKNKWLSGREADLIKGFISEQMKINELKKELANKEKERDRLIQDLKRARDNYKLYARNGKGASTAESAEKEKLRAKYRKKISDIDLEIDAVNDEIEKLQKDIRECEKSLADRVSNTWFVKKFKRGIFG